MSGFTIIFHFEAGSMTCASCSLAIRGIIRDHLTFKNIRFKDEDILADYRSLKAEVTLTNLDKEAAEKLASELQKEPDEQPAEKGLSNKSPSAPTLSPAYEATYKVIPSHSKRETRPPLTFSPKEWLYPFPPLALGSALMAAEHLCWLPSVHSTNGLAFNYGMGGLATALTLITGYPHFRNSLRLIYHGQSDSGAMDHLITLSSVSAIGYSFLMLALPKFFNASGHTFFSVPLFVLGLLKLSHTVRNYLHNQIQSEMDSITDAKNLLPDTTLVIATLDEKDTQMLANEKDGENRKAEEIVIGSTIKVLPGKKVPIDSILEYSVRVKEQKDSKQYFMRKKCGDVILEGTINEDDIPFTLAHNNSKIQVLPGQRASVTGILESFPVGATVQEDYMGKLGDTPKIPGNTVHANAFNSGQFPLYLKTIARAADNHIARASASFRQTDSISNQLLQEVTKVFLPVVMEIAALSFLGWEIFGPKPSLGFATQVFLSVPMCACPCSIPLILILPSIIKSVAFKNGILIQDTKALEKIPTIIATDKNGTLTQIHLQLKEIFSFTSGSYNLQKAREDQEQKAEQEEEINDCLAMAIQLEAQIPVSTRGAVAEAIEKAAKKRQLNLTEYPCTEFKTNPLNADKGGIAVVKGQQVVFGNAQLLKNQGISVDQVQLEKAAEYSKNHKLPVFMAIKNQVSHLFIFEEKEEVQQKFRPNAVAALKELKRRGLNTAILTGDTHESTTALVNTTGDLGEIELFCGLNPDDKIKIIRRLKSRPNAVIAYLGEGLNDLGGMQKSDIGIAIDSQVPVRFHAGVTLNGDWWSLIQYLDLAKIYRRANKISIAIALGINSLALLSATGITYPLNDRLLDPSLLGSVMAISSLLLVINMAIVKKFAERSFTKNLSPQLSVFPSQPESKQPLLSTHEHDTSESFYQYA